MTTIVLELPLYNEADYEYDTTLNGVSYTIRMFYCERNQSWYLDFQDQEVEEFIIQGERLSERNKTYHSVVDNSYFYLEPVGNTTNTNIERDPYRIDRWCKLYYVFQQEDTTV